MSVRVIHRKDTITPGPITYDIWGFRMEEDGSLSLVDEQDSILGIIAPGIWEGVFVMKEAR